MPRGSEDNRIDQVAFQELFKTHEADLFRYARYLSDSQSAADDIYQETWLRVATFLQHKPVIRNFKNFLFSVATNIHRDDLKKRKVRRFFLGPSINDENEHQHIWVASEFKPDDLLSDALEESLQQLSARQRSMFCLSYIEGFKISEISQMMNCAEGTVKATIYKAVQKLRQDLKEFRE